MMFVPRMHLWPQEDCSFENEAELRNSQNLEKAVRLGPSGFSLV